MGAADLAGGVGAAFKLVFLGTIAGAGPLDALWNPPGSIPGPWAGFSAVVGNCSSEVAPGEEEDCEEELSSGVLPLGEPGAGLRRPNTLVRRPICWCSPKEGPRLSCYLKQLKHTTKQSITDYCVSCAMAGAALVSWDEIKMRFQAPSTSTCCSKFHAFNGAKSWIAAKKIFACLVARPVHAARQDASLSWVCHWRS
jgi:hypothetical protein